MEKPDHVEAVKPDLQSDSGGEAIVDAWCGDDLVGVFEHAAELGGRTDAVGGVDLFGGHGVCVAVLLLCGTV
jgi:hypothetical protein